AGTGSSSSSTARHRPRRRAYRLLVDEGAKARIACRWATGAWSVSGKSAMEKPAGGDRFFADAPHHAKDPEPQPLFVFNVVVIARAIMATPPFTGDAFRTDNMRERMDPPLVRKLPWSPH